MNESSAKDLCGPVDEVPGCELGNLGRGSCLGIR